MIETFDAYAQKTKLYYILQVFSILTILGIVIARITNLQVLPKYMPYLSVLVVLGLIALVLNLLLTSTGLVKMYKKNGDLTISTEPILINLTTIFLEDIQKIDIKANDFKGARSSDGSGNRLEIRTKSNKVIICRFVINSKTQLDNLRQILEQWKASGVEVISN